MKPCFLSKSHRLMIWTNRILSPIYLLIFSLCTIIGFHQDLPIYMPLLFLALMVAYLRYSILFELCFSREYELDRNGIRIRYLKCFVRSYPWESINKICLCSVHFSRRTDTFDQVIWCCAGALPDGPPNPETKWTQAGYTLRHFRTALQIEFSLERLQEFQTLAPLPIEDYRGKFL